MYIDCEKGVRIYHYGNRTLECYIPSLKSGRNMVKLIYRDFVNKPNTETTINEYDVERDGKTIHVVKENISIIDKELFNKELNSNSIIWNVVETDSEILFRFHAKNMKKLEKYLKPKTSGASISPFSTRNLPKNKEYKIPDEEFAMYKNNVAKIPKECILSLTHMTNYYLKSLVTKKNSWEDIKADMALKGLKSKEYIHSIGKWNDYITYLEDNL